jgi:hypothetical protein
MEKRAAEGPVCEVCAKDVARRGDLLCGDCSYAFTVMLEILHGHPEVDVQDLERVRQVFEWRMKKKRLVSSQPEVQEEEKTLSAALSVLRRKQASAATEQKTATVSDT